MDRYVGPSKFQLTADIIAKVAMDKMDVVNAATLLNKSRRTIECYLQRYREVGIKIVVHQNTGKPCHIIKPVIEQNVKYSR